MVNRFVPSLKNELGYGQSQFLIASSLIFAVNVCFYILSIGSLFSPIIYPLIDRVTYSTPFVEHYIFDEHKDYLIILIATILWFTISLRSNVKYIFIIAYLITLASTLTFHTIISQVVMSLTIPSILVMILYDKLSKHNRIIYNIKLIVTYSSLITLFFCGISVFVLITELFYPKTELPSINYLYYYYLLFSTASPLLIGLLGFSVLIKITITYTSNIIFNRAQFARTGFPGLKKRIFKTRRIIVVLALIILISLIVTAIPHLASDNTGAAIGDDTKDYLQFLTSMKHTTSFKDLALDAFVIQSSGDRGLSLLIFYFLINFLNISNMMTAIDYLPFFLSPPLVIAIYLLTRKVTSDDISSVMASLMTITSFQILIGIYGGLFANWLALIFGYICFIFLIDYVSSPTRPKLIMVSVLLIAVVLSHAPTWAIFLVVILIYLSIIYIWNHYVKRKNIVILFLMTTPSIIIDIVRILLLDTSGILQDITFAQAQGAGFQNFSIIWENLSMTAHIYLGGQFANPIILILVTYWIFNSNLKKTSLTWIFIFLVLIIIPVFVGSSEVQARFMYEIPFQIPAAIAVASLRYKYGNIAVIAISLTLLILTIRTVSNFTFLEFDVS